jgi:hypothetical protein
MYAPKMSLKMHMIHSKHAISSVKNLDKFMSQFYIQSYV